MSLVKYVDEIVRPALVDTFILAKCQSGNVTVDQLERDWRGTGIDLGDLDVRERVRMLQDSGHLREEGNNVKCTDDGKEDVQKVLPWFQKVSSQLSTAPAGARR